MTQNETQSPLLGVQVGITENDVTVTDSQRAGELITELMGSPRRFESDGDCGWLVEFTDDEMDELKSNGYFGRENDDRSLEAEWI